MSSFRSWDPGHLARFNSGVSCTLLSRYEQFVTEAIQRQSVQPPHQTFAPSSARCQRIQWFRIRGVEPDAPKDIDKVTEFTARVGEACHRMIQGYLSQMLGPDWLSVADYVNSDECPDWALVKRANSEYTLNQSADGFETQFEMRSPYPIRFACDGIIRIDGKLYLLEIKSSEYTKWDDLTDSKDEHIRQVSYYATLLGLTDVLFIYIDRMYGGLKCYQHTVTTSVRDDVIAEMDSVLEHVDINIPPKGLPKGDKWCSAVYCPYYIKCHQWGGR